MVVDTWHLPVQPLVAWQLLQEVTLPVVQLDPPSMRFPSPPLVVTHMEVRFQVEHTMPVVKART